MNIGESITMLYTGYEDKNGKPLYCNDLVVIQEPIVDGIPANHVGQIKLFDLDQYDIFIVAVPLEESEAVFILSQVRENIAKLTYEY